MKSWKSGYLSLKGKVTNGLALPIILNLASLIHTPNNVIKDILWKGSNIAERNHVTLPKLYWWNIPTSHVYRKMEANLLGHQERKWNELFKDPFLMTRETKSQTFQYKIIRRIIDCNEKLYHMKIRTTPTLSKCDELDDIIHFFVLCPETYSFCLSLYRWWNTNTPIGNQIHLTIFPERKQMILGITSRKSDLCYVLYHCDMHAQ